MKKNIILVIFVVISFFLTGCGIDAKKDNPDVIRVGESCNIYDNEELIATVTYIGCVQEELEDNSEMILIKETITIIPITKIKLEDKDFFIEVGYGTYASDSCKYSTDEACNIETNQFNIFDSEIVEEITYDFCFIIPKEKNGLEYNQIGIAFQIVQGYSLVYI